jgi:2-(1,2-epoxy-1,2-dihydrophenyl)acetyl-CoA isomerase
MQVVDGLAELVLASPQTRNAINPEWVAALAAAVAEFVAHDGVRALLIRAEGPSFTVGGDLRHFAATLDELPQQLDAMVSSYHETLAQLAELPVPVVCAARGAIAGGGLGLLWAADVVVLGDDARLLPAHARLGLSGDGGSSWYLPRLVGLRRAAELMIEARTLDAAEAVTWGLATRAVPAAELDEAGRVSARSLADGPTTAYGEMRRLLRGALELPLRQGLNAEREANVRCGATSDAREGMRAFAERRSPRFTGE